MLSHYATSRILVRWITTTLLVTSHVSVLAEHLMDSEGRPVLTEEGCIQTPNSSHHSDQPFQECGDVLDRDQDGVPDDQDQCPDNSSLEISKGVYGDQTVSKSLIGKRGCPVDTDSDGIPDYRDECLQTPPRERDCINERGCSRDDDQDGVVDCSDQCPHTLPGGNVDIHGCVNIIEITKTILGSDITFAFGKHQLTAQGQLELDKIAQSVLGDLPLIEAIVIIGHTDSVGLEHSNQRLSEQRASSVANYLMSKGIPATLVQQEGRGEREPIADNQSKIGRAKNRRVELTVKTKR